MYFLKKIVGDFWSIVQKHNAQFLKRNSYMPTFVLHDHNFSRGVVSTGGRCLGKNI